MSSFYPKHLEPRAPETLVERRKRRYAQVARDLGARGEHLIALALSDTFEPLVLKRLALRDVLKMPLVCSAMRAATSARREEWLRVVFAAAVVRVERSLPTNFLRRQGHNNALKRFFGFPKTWIIQLVGKTRRDERARQSFEEHLRLHRVMLSEGATYESLREEARLAFLGWQSKLRQLYATSARMLPTEKAHAELVAAVARAKSAHGAVQGFFLKHDIKCELDGFGRDCGWLVKIHMMKQALEIE
jgi:hypothetical protein